MLDPEAAWWAKLRRADEHLIVVADLFHDFQATEPYTLTPEDTDNPDEVAYRLRVHREAPADLITWWGTCCTTSGRRWTLSLSGWRCARSTAS